MWVSPAGELPEPLGRVHLDVRLDDKFAAQDLLDPGATQMWDEPQGRWSVYTDHRGQPMLRGPYPQSPA